MNNWIIKLHNDGKIYFSAAGLQQVHQRRHKDDLLGSQLKFPKEIREKQVKVTEELADQYSTAFIM